MRKESSSTALVVLALAPFVIDQVTSLRERGVTECILSGHAGVSWGEPLRAPPSPKNGCAVYIDNRT